MCIQYFFNQSQRCFVFEELEMTCWPSSVLQTGYYMCCVCVFDLTIPGTAFHGLWPQSRQCTHSADSGPCPLILRFSSREGVQHFLRSSTFFRPKFALLAAELFVLDLSGKKKTSPPHRDAPRSKSKKRGSDVRSELPTYTGTFEELTWD